MKADEKLCPRCAETIKRAAHLCKHCGHKFSEAEIAEGSKKDSQSAVRNGLGCIAVVVGMILAVSMCSSGKKATESGSEAANATTEDTDSEANPYADVGRQSLWIVRSKDAIRQRLKDPDSAQFRNVRFYSGGPSPVACGEVNAKNAFGGYGGFERFVASGTKLAFVASDMTSPAEMDKVWKQMCVKRATDEAYVP